MKLSISAWIIIGCTLFNIVYFIGMMIRFHKARKADVCLRCKRNGVRSSVCYRCKNFKYSLTYGCLKHPELLSLSLLEDNYRRANTSQRPTIPAKKLGRYTTIDY